MFFNHLIKFIKIQLDNGQNKIIILLLIVLKFVTNIKKITKNVL